MSKTDRIHIADLQGRVAQLEAEAHSLAGFRYTHEELHRKRERQRGPAFALSTGYGWSTFDNEAISGDVGFRWVSGEGRLMVSWDAGRSWGHTDWFDIPGGAIQAVFIRQPLGERYPAVVIAHIETAHKMHAFAGTSPENVTIMEMGRP